MEDGSEVTREKAVMGFRERDMESGADFVRRGRELAVRRDPHCVKDGMINALLGEGKASDAEVRTEGFGIPGIPGNRHGQTYNVRKRGVNQPAANRSGG